MTTVRNQVLLSLYADFENFSVFKPGPTKEQSVNDMLDQLIAWGDALKTLRLEHAAGAYACMRQGKARSRMMLVIV